MMSPEVYKKEVAGLMGIYQPTKNEFYKSEYFGSYMLVSSGLTTYLPQLKTADHLKVTRDVVFHKSLTYIDQFCLDAFNSLVVIDSENALEPKKETGTIYVTYHTGSYRLFLFQLVSQNIPFCLVTEGDYIHNQGEETQELFRYMTKNETAELDIISAEDSRLLFKLKNKLSEGISVVFYIDGNTGVTVNENRSNNNLYKTSFLNHHIYARQGIAFLAYISKAPIVTAICRRNEDLTNILEVRKVKVDDIYDTREDFVHGVTKLLYKELEEFLKETPEQWEGWFYVNKYHDPYSAQDIDIQEQIKGSAKDNHVTLAIDDFAELYAYDDKHFITLKKDLKTLQIDGEKYRLIDFFSSGCQLTPYEPVSIGEQHYPWSVLEQMVRMKILKIS